MPTADPGPLTQEVAALIRARMARFNISGVDLAKSVGVSQSQFSKITRGVKDIDVDLLERVCFALGMDLTDVVREAEQTVVNSGHMPVVGELFVEDNVRIPAQQQTGVGEGQDTVQVDELGLAANTEDHSPDEDLRNP